MRKRSNYIVYLSIFSFLFLSSLNLCAEKKPPRGGKELAFSSDFLDWRPSGGRKSEATFTVVKTSHRAFKKAREIVIEKNTSHETDIQLVGKTTDSIKKGDVLLLSFYARCTASSDESALGHLTVLLQARKTKKTETLFNRTFMPEKKWKRFFLRTTAPINNGEGYTVSFRLGGTKPQTLQIAKLQLLNYRDLYAIEKLPKTEISYPGMDPRAPWRKEAQARINKYRKEELKVLVLDGKGRPVPRAKVEVKLQRHAYGFGAAIALHAMFNEKNVEDAKQYQMAVTNLFNKVVFENRLKWKYFRENDAVLKEAIDWCQTNNLPIRGHCLVWPAWRRLPPAMEQEFADRPEEFRLEIARHIQKMVNLYPDAFCEWDVVNELYSEHQFVDLLGKEAVVDWFKITKEANPNFKRYINDYAILAGHDQAHQDNYYEWIRYLLDHGAPVDGIGLQSHFRAPVSPEEIYARLDRFAQFGLEMQITEYDFGDPDELLQARFTRDFMTVVFSHPKTVGILTWCLWEKASWRGNIAFYDKDWKKRRIALAWEHMIKKEWNTSATLRTNQEGLAQIRGFLGEYKIVVFANGRKKTVPFNLQKGADVLEVSL